MASLIFLLSYGISFVFFTIYVSPYGILLWLITSYAIGFLSVVVFYLLNFPVVLWLRPSHPYKTYLMKSLAFFLKVFVLNLKTEIRGVENIPKQGKLIAYANHKSYTDAFALMSYFPRSIALTPKKSVFKIPFLKWWLKAYDCLPINRTNPKETLRDMEKAIDTVRRGQVILFFPEGTIRNRLQPKVEMAKAGSFRLAKKAEADILPIRYEGNDLVRKHWPRRTTRMITIYPVIAYESFRDLNTQEIAQKFMDTINQD